MLEFFCFLLNKRWFEYIYQEKFVAVISFEMPYRNKMFKTFWGYTHVEKGGGGIIGESSPVIVEL